MSWNNKYALVTQKKWCGEGVVQTQECEGSTQLTTCRHLLLVECLRVPGVWGVTQELGGTSAFSGEQLGTAPWDVSGGTNVQGISWSCKGDMFVQPGQKKSKEG